MTLIVVAWGAWATGCSSPEPATAVAVGGARHVTESHGCPPATWVNRDALVGVPELCGGCDPACHVTQDQPDQTDLDTSALIDAQGVVYDGAAGGVVIGSSTSTRGLYAWIANSWESTVTKVTLDVPRTAVGVYRVGLESQHNPTGGNWDWGNRPSRTAVDAQGNAYVLSRALGGGQSMVTKIAAEYSDCIDYDADLILDTSSGLGDILGWPGNSDQDECILWNQPVGDPGGVGRAIAVDALGRLWVGLHDAYEFVVLSSVDGSEIARISVPWRPYGATIGANGVLWYTSYEDWFIGSIDTTSDPPSSADLGAVVGTPEQPYGIAVDQFNRVFLADLQNGGIQRYDPSTGNWALGNDPANSRIAGIALTAEGYVYGAGIDANRISIFDMETLATLYSYDTGAFGALSPWGVCADFDGNVWAANFNSPDVTVVRAGTGVVEVVPVEGLSYTYSDFTGYSNMTFVASSASLVRDYDAYTSCGAGNVSMRNAVRWEAAFPDGGELLFYGRAAPDQITLGTRSEVLLGSTTSPSGLFDIDELMDAAGQPSEERYFRIRIELIRGGESPVLRSYSLEEYCQ